MLPQCSQHSSERERQIKMASLKETRVMIDNVNNSQNSYFIMQISKLCKRIRLHLLFLWTLREHCFRSWCSKLCRRWQLVWTSSILSWRCQCFSALMDLPFVQPGNAQISRWNFQLHAFAFQKIVWGLWRGDRYSSLCSVCVVYKYLCEGGGGVTQIFFVFQDLKICTSFFDVQIVYIPFSPIVV